MTGLAALPLVLFIGCGIDLAKSQSETQRIQQAADAAALAAARLPRSASQAQREDQARIIFEANMGTALEGAQIAQSFDGFKVTVKVDYVYKTTFMHLLGARTIPINVQVSAETAATDLDVVLVLDNSLSMSGSGRIAALRTAAGNFVSSLSKIQGGHIQIAVVPFDDKVAVGDGVLTTQTSISEAVLVKPPASGDAGPIADKLSDKAEISAVTDGSWTGCVVDRPAPFDQNGTAPTLSNAATLYPRQDCKSSKLKRVRGLSPSLDGAKTLIGSMTPNGLTNITIGLQWGLEAFTPTAPLGGSNPKAARIMVLMTDGENTDSRWNISISQMNARTSAICADIKKHDIVLYTINMRDGDKALLRGCATSPAHFYNVRAASELIPVFDEIAGNLTPVRLSQ